MNTQTKRIKEKTIKCAKCDRLAKYDYYSPFGHFYRCGIHDRKFKNNICVVVKRI
ncbi:hypothetical protein M0R04_15475 [Candidatus Dojkabacteria bacterium]|jgi:hypothetical protein|nr:hypothetical protein [Candidatus Dojkabacteria bacterium]